MYPPRDLRGAWRITSRPARGLSGVVVLIGAALAGCGLIDFDSFRDINYRLSPQTFVVDTEDGAWEKPPAGALPAIPCQGSSSTTCCQAPGVDCARYPLQCRDAQCVYPFRYVAAQEIDVRSAVSGIERGQTAVREIKLTSVDYTVANDLNVHLPPVEVWVAPRGVTSTADGRARRVTVLPAQARMSRGTHRVPVDAAGQDNFSSFARNLSTPFNLLTVVEMTLAGGQIVPAGRATLTVAGQVAVQF